MEQLERRSLLTAYVWNNPAGGAWNDPGNWSPNGVPGTNALDTATIQIPGTYTVTFQGTPRTLQSLTIAGGGQSLEVAGDLTLTGPSAVQAGGELTVRAGSLGGSGDLAVAGQLNWTGGTLTGPGRTQIAAAGNLFASSSGTITSTRAVDVNGKLQVEAGTVNLAAGGVHGGVIEIAQSATLELRTVHTMDTASALIGDGQARFVSATANVSGLTDIGALVMTSGTAAFSSSVKSNVLTSTGGAITFEQTTSINSITLSGGSIGGGGDVSLAGLMNWTGGSVGGLGKLIVPQFAEVRIESGFPAKGISRDLQLDGLLRINNTAASMTGNVVIGSTGNIIASGTATFDAPENDTGSAALHGSLTTLPNTAFSMRTPLTAHAGAQILLAAGTSKFLGGLNGAAGSAIQIAANHEMELRGQSVLGSQLVSSGKLTFRGVSLSTTSSFSLDGGSFVGALGTATLNAGTFSPTQIEGNGAQITLGEGVLASQPHVTMSGSVLSLNATNATRFRTLNIVSGTVNLNSELRVEESGSFTYSGSFSGTGKLVIGPAATFAIVPTPENTVSLKVLNLPLEVFGHLTLRSTLELRRGTGGFGQITVQDGGTMQIVGGAILSINSDYSGQSLTNYGQLNLDLIGMCFFSQVDFHNFGKCQISGGDVFFSNNVGADSSQLTGDVTISNTVLHISTPTTLNANLEVRAGGTIAALPAMTAINGHLKLSDGVDLTMAPAGGTLTVAGTILLSPGSLLSVTGNMTFAGNGPVLHMQFDDLSGPAQVNVSGAVSLGGGATRTRIVAELVGSADPPSGAICASVFSLIGINGVPDSFGGDVTTSNRSLQLLRVNPNLFRVTVANGLIAPPSVVNQVHLYQIAPLLRVTFDSDVGMFIDRSDLSLIDLDLLGPLPQNIGAFQYSGLIGSLTLPTFLADGNYRLQLHAQTIYNSAGLALTPPTPLDFFIFAGDANHDRVIDINDFATLAASFGRPAIYTQGDFNYDGTADIADFAILASKFNTALALPLQRALRADATIGASVGRPGPWIVEFPRPGVTADTTFNSDVIQLL